MTIDEINTIRLALDTPENNKHYIKHTTDAKIILNKQQAAINYTHSCTEVCEHKNETLRQGDGFTYSVCSDCGEDL